MQNYKKGNNMSDEVVKEEPRYTLIPDRKNLQFILNRGEFKGISVKIKLPIDYVDPDTKEEVDLNIKYSKKKAKHLTKEQIEEEAAQCFLEIYNISAKKKAVEYLAKVKNENKKVKI